jgi:hypothetical protein
VVNPKAGPLASPLAAVPGGGTPGHRIEADHRPRPRLEAGGAILDVTRLVTPS